MRKYICLLPVFLGKPEKVFRKILFVVVLISMMFSLVSCRTVKGLGEDIEHAGEKGSEVLGEK